MISEVEKAAFAADHKDGLTYDALAAKYGISHSAVRCRVHNLGLAKTRPPSNAVDHTRVNELINQGLSNTEIKAILGPIPKSRLARQRIVCGKQTYKAGPRRVMDEDAEPYSKPNHLKPWPGSCPKCSGLPVPFLQIQRCTVCGLTNESESYFDAHSGERVGI